MFEKRWLAVSLLTCALGLAVGVARGGKGTMPPQFLENIAILCFKRRFFKQNSVIRLKSNNLTSPKFFAPPKFLGWLSHWLLGWASHKYVCIAIFLALLVTNRTVTKSAVVGLSGVLDILNFDKQSTDL